MTEFHWIEWNLQKIDNHALSREEVEFAWHHRNDFKKRKHPEGMSWESKRTCPSGRQITIVWRYNLIDDQEKVFVITAY